MQNLSLLDLLFLFQWLGAAAYLLFLFISAFGLSRLKSVAEAESFFVSIIIAARNEGENISACLKHALTQSYDPARYEIIVVDDHSDDDTFTICQSFAKKYARIKLLSLGDCNGVSPKKAALQTGISACRGDIILTTDADCRVSPTWIETMTGHFDKETGAVASWLLVDENGKMLGKLESLDSLALVSIGAAGFGLNRPFVANGANFGYRKQVYQELNGFDGLADYVSGDDDLFLHKIVKSGKWRCRFVADPAAIVSTKANTTLKSFFAQRIRWASKSGVYPAWLVLLETLIYLYYASMVVSLAVCIFSGFAKWIIITPFFIKVTADGLFLAANARRVGRSFKLRYLLPAEWLQIAYVLIAGLWGLLGNYTWKGRTYTRGKVKKVYD